MIRVTLKQIEAFRWAAFFGSFKAAAEHLHTTQPALSLRISKLEQLLGVELFEPGSRPAHLTSKGRELTALAEDILGGVTRFEQKVIEPANQTGVIRLGVSESIVELCLAEILNRMKAAYPNVRIEVTVDVTVSLREEMLANKLDICMMLGPSTDYRIENQPLCEFDLAWIAHPDLALPGAGQVTERDIAQYPILTFGNQTRIYREIERHFAECGVGKVNIFASNSLLACQRLVVDRIGVACVTEPMARQLEERFGLRIIDLDWRPSTQVCTVSYLSMPRHALVEEFTRIAQGAAAEALSSVGLPAGRVTPAPEDGQLSVSARGHRDPGRETIESAE